MTREQIINNMCLTFRHDYGLEISEDDRMYTLMSGMTKQEREALYRDMAQIFDNDIAPLLEEFHQLKNGEAIVVPKDSLHAQAMLGVAQYYLDTNK